MGNLTHEQLAIEFDKAKNGDNEAFAKIYMATNKSQYFLALTNLKNEQMAEDVVQDLYVKLFKSLNNIESGTALIAYMNTMNYHMCMTRLNKEKKNSKTDIDDLQYILVDDKDQPNETVNKKSDTNLIYMALSKLDKRLSSVLIMRYIDEMKITEVASTLNISTRSVLRYTEQGCEKMRKLLGELKNKVYSLPLFSVPFIASALRKARDESFPLDKQTAIFERIMNDDSLKGVVSATTATAAGTVAMKAVPYFSKSFYAIGGVVGITAITAMGMRILPPSYNINYVTNLTNYNPSYVELSVQKEGAIGIAGVELINANNEVISRGNAENNYTIYADQNGEYTLRVVGDNSSESTEVIHISTVDNQSPTVSNASYNSEDISFDINDDLSGIDYNNISLVSDYGEKIEYWMDGNTIHYSNAYSIAVITLYDNVGNANTVTLSIQ